MTHLVSAFVARAKSNRTEFVRFLKFATVGAIGAVVDYSVLNLGVQVLRLHLLVANAFSFTAAVLSNFTWNRLWTYPESRAEPLLGQLGQFALVNVVGLGINELILMSLDPFVSRVWPKWGYNISKAVAIGVVLFWNYGINRIWTYRKVK
jgi:putative flippase GtrA